MQKLRKILSIYVVSHADNYSAPIGERSIMRSVSVCLPAIISSELHVILGMLPMAVQARSASGGV